jgi:hypothetical protein
MLALDVLTDAARGLREVRRVTRKGGTVTVVVPNFRCGWTPFSLVWDAAPQVCHRFGSPSQLSATAQDKLGVIGELRRE